MERGMLMSAAGLRRDPADRNRVNENEPEIRKRPWRAAFIGGPLRTTGTGAA